MSKYTLLICERCKCEFFEDDLQRRLVFGGSTEEPAEYVDECPFCGHDECVEKMVECPYCKEIDLPWEGGECRNCGNETLFEVENEPQRVSG